jgi:hypothetical protein
MMKKLGLIAFVILVLTNFQLSAQDNVIRVTNTNIFLPDTITIDTLIQGEQTFIKLIIKNERSNSLEVKNIKTPPGTGASIENTHIKPKGQSELYIGFDTNFMNQTGNFVAKIVLETNLIRDIVINIKGFVKEPEADAN